MKCHILGLDVTVDHILSMKVLDRTQGLVDPSLQFELVLDRASSLNK